MDRRFVKWLGLIFDDSVDFDIHLKSRIAKARKALRALSGVGPGVEGGIWQDDSIHRDLESRVWMEGATSVIKHGHPRD